MARIALLTAQFEDLVSHGLRSILGDDPDMELLAYDVPMGSLQATIAEYEPDIAILDYGSLRSPIEVHQLHEAQPETRLVLLASGPSQAECTQLLAFGATAVLSKDTPKADLLAALRLALRGTQIVQRPDGHVEAERLGPDLLTPREADVLELLQAGHSNAEIAHRLSVGVETVRTHASSIYRKLGVSSRRDLAAAPMLRPR